jgi:7-cyano-7-deazaguanine tRNA-ribosyltransferase
VALSFEISDRAAAGRIGRIETPHGRLTTPTLLPVVNPNLRLIPPQDLKRLFGAEGLITNSYIIYKHQDLRETALEKGVHSLVDFDGPIMTDSGTFQQYVYGDVPLKGEEIVAFQRDIGTDIGTALDVFSTPERTFEEAREDLEETAKRVEAASHHKGEMALAATVQGGVHPILREHAAHAVAPYGDVFPIGGVVPLMERQRYADLARVILAAKRGLPPGHPVHLFGCGHPVVFPLAAALGCDLFDSSAYAKYARDGRYITPTGTLHLDQLRQSICHCPVCSQHGPKELMRMEAPTRMRLLAEHNLHVTFSTLRSVRQAISDGTLWELVERTAASHPRLLDALAVLREEPHKNQLEESEPVSGERALFYTSGHTVHRPLLHRLHNRLLTRWRPPQADRYVLLEESERPFSEKQADRLAHHLKKDHTHFIVDSWLGPVPIELDHLYPFAQSVVPKRIDEGARRHLAGLLSALLDERLSVPVIRDHEESDEDSTFYTQEELYQDPALALAQQDKGPGIEDWDLDVLRVGATCDMQMGTDAALALLGPVHQRKERLRFVKSRSTGKIRNILFDGEHVASLRAEDGLLSLRTPGAQRLHEGLRAPRLRVQVDEESSAFNAQGRNVMAAFVQTMDPALRPGDECIVVDEHDTLVAHGRVRLNAREAASFQRGIAVRVREGMAKAQTVRASESA